MVFGPVCRLSSSFWRKPESILILFFCPQRCRASTRPTGERVTFFACAKKDNQRNTPPAARSSGILPYDFARVLRGSPDVLPCTFGERAHIVCALLRTDPTHPRRATGGPVWAASCRRCRSKSRASSSLTVTSRQCRHARIRGSTVPFSVPSIAGVAGKCPEGSRRRIAAIAKQYTDVLSEQPRRAEKRRGF